MAAPAGSQQAAPQSKQPNVEARKQNMADLFTTYWGDEPVPLTVEPQPLRPAAHPLVLGKAAAGSDAGVLAPFGNAQRNSRLSAPLAMEATNLAGYVLRWSAEIPEPFHPHAL